MRRQMASVNLTALQHILAVLHTCIMRIIFFRIPKLWNGRSLVQRLANDLIHGQGGSTKCYSRRTGRL
jgi:hypothetical protein